MLFCDKIFIKEGAVMEKKITALREKLNEYNRQYYVLDNPSVSDYEYDMLLRTAPCGFVL